jgi:hypothetical protein
VGGLRDKGFKVSQFPDGGSDVGMSSKPREPMDFLGP